MRCWRRRTATPTSGPLEPRTTCTRETCDGLLAAALERLGQDPRVRRCAPDDPALEWAKDELGHTARSLEGAPLAEAEFAMTECLAAALERLHLRLDLLFTAHATTGFPGSALH